MSTAVPKPVKMVSPKSWPTLTYLIKWIERKVRLELDAALAPLEISVPEYTALSVLRENRELSSAQLARRTFVSAQAMHPIVMGLLAKRLILRRDDPGHGRIHLVRLSEQGKKVLEECNTACAEAETRAFAGISRAEAETLRKALERCVQSISNNEG